MVTERNRTFLLKSRPVGKPNLSNFELVQRPIPTADDGDILLRTIFLSVDPVVRDRMSEEESYADPWDIGKPLQARTMGRVVELNHDDWQTDEFVVTSWTDWAEYNVVPGGTVNPVDPETAPLPAALGLVGLPGWTAYFGMLDVGDRVEVDFIPTEDENLAIPVFEVVE